MATEKRLIYCGDVMRLLRESKVPETGAFSKGINKGLNIALSTIGNEQILPSVDAVEVVHGRWNQDGVYDVCSVCNSCTLMPHLKGLSKFNYCPNCGAKMDGDGNDYVM